MILVGERCGERVGRSLCYSRGSGHVGSYLGHVLLRKPTLSRLGLRREAGHGGHGGTGLVGAWPAAPRSL